MRTMNYRYVEDFMEVASQLEQDLLEERKLHKPVAASKPPSLEPPRQSPAYQKPQAQWRNREGDYRPPGRTQTYGNQHCANCNQNHRAGQCPAIEPPPPPRAEKKLNEKAATVGNLSEGRLVENPRCGNVGDPNREQPRPVRHNQNRPVIDTVVNGRAYEALIDSGRIWCSSRTAYLTSE